MHPGVRVTITQQVSRPAVRLVRFAVFGLALLAAVPAVSAAETGLKDAYRRYFPIGAAIPGASLPEAELNLLITNFASVTPDNLMKLSSLQPEEGKFRFDDADRFVEFAQSHGLQVQGHTLVWYQQCPDWLFQDGGKPASRELVLKRMREHISTVVGRYRGRIARWDVVNEAIDDENDYLRATPWFKATGEDFIAEAFLAARRADPNARLFYNDYNIEHPVKREKALRLIKSLKARGVPIHGIGIQGHWKLDEVPFDFIDESIAAFSAQGLRVAISELDIDVVPRKPPPGSDPAGYDPYAGGCPPEILARQAEQYARLFQIFKKHAGKIDVVTFWGLHDGRSWLNGWPRRRTNYPLLWDRSLAPKPALEAVLRAAQ